MNSKTILTTDALPQAAAKLMSHFRRMALTAALLGALAVPSVLAGTEATQRFADSFGTLILNPCSGEIVDVELTFKRTVHSSTDAVGGVHVAAHDVVGGVGLGLSTGAVYIVRQIDATILNGKVGIEETQPMHLAVISKQGTSNFFLKFLFHITFDANGTMRASVSNFSTECQ